MANKLNAAQMDNLPRSTRSSLLLGTSTTEVVTPAALYAAQASTLVSFGSTIALNFSAGLNWHFSITSAFTLANPSGLIAGQSGRIRMIQTTAGPAYAVGFGSYWKFPNATIPTLSSPGSSAVVDLLCYFVHDATTIEATVVKAVG